MHLHFLVIGVIKIWRCGYPGDDGQEASEVRMALYVGGSFRSSFIKSF